MISGPDPDFPFLSEDEHFLFPPALTAKHDSIVAWGGNLSPGMLLSAYEQGLFPWYSNSEPVIWHSPDPRFVIFPGKLHISKSMEKVLKQNKFLVTINKDFQSVIKNCSKIKRPRQSGTWLTIDMINAYLELDRLGWVRSAEAFYEGELEGGCYGVRIGNVFFGESMFSKKTNASKAAFLTLAQVLFSDGVNIIDCQQHTRHLESLGAEEISRKEFLAILNKEFGGNSPDRSTLRR